jgi:Nucleotidyl transferase AbiEii toxin, Type IV TA system
VLESLDAALLLKHGCLFGGGTAAALAHGEYRESVDLDFICASVEGYRELRGRVNRGGIGTLCKAPLALLREPRIDQYGIRCAFEVEGAPVKFELIFEGRITLDDPLPGDRIAGVWRLTHDDQVATKLMANSDRWADASVMSRDLIDLAMLCHDGHLPPAALAKARHAYGASVLSDLAKAKQQLLEEAGRVKQCMRAMGMTMTEAELRARVQALHTTMPRPRAASAKRPP